MIVECFENKKLVCKDFVIKNDTITLSLIKERNDYKNIINLILDDLKKLIQCDIILSQKPYEEELLHCENDAITKNTGIYVYDIEEDCRKYIFSPTTHNTISFFCFPLLFNDINIGCITFLSYEKQDFTPYISQIIEKCMIISKILYFSLYFPPSIEQHKEIDDTKDKFLATMSHELRTPLNGIVGMLSMFRDAGPMNNKQLEYLSILTECSFQLTSLMNNILDFSKMASNRLVLLRQPISIKKIIEDSMNMIEGKAIAKNINTLVVYSDEIPSSVMGDSQRLTQVITNLLTNSVKFTDKGYVKITVKPRKLDSLSDFVKKWKITFEVQDSGIGIENNEYDKIFEAFYQSKNRGVDKDNFSRGGAGMGLSIAKEIVRLMGGTLHVYSEGKNLGSCFSFSVIFEEEICISTIQADYKEMFNGAKILVVDDRPEIRLQITDMLLKWKCIPTTVSSGEEALAYLKHGTEFKVGILDISMPYMSGIELAQEIRSQWKHIPLIGLSSVDITTGMELFDHYMSKPVDQSLLFPVVLDCLYKTVDPQKTVTTSSPREFSNIAHPNKRIVKPKNEIRILIAEDDRINAFTIKEMLGYIGYDLNKIVIVDNGEKCVNELKKHKDQQPYDVVLMDIIMPVMDGLEAIKHIRQFRNPPYVIAVSAAIQNTDRQRCHQVGIDGFLTKPLIKEKLESALSPLTISYSPQLKNRN